MRHRTVFNVPAGRVSRGGGDLRRSLPGFLWAAGLALAAYYGFGEVVGPKPSEALPRMHFSMCGPGSTPTCVVDGDTFRLNGERMRIESIDTPETHTNLCGGKREMALGRRAGTRLAELLNSGPLSVTRTGHDKYGRTLVLVRAGGRDLGEVLIGEGLARRWPDGEEFWCR